MQFAFLMRYEQCEDISHLSLLWTLLFFREIVYLWNQKEQVRETRKFSTAVPDAWPRYRHCSMDFLKMIFKLGLEILEILSWGFSARKFMDVLWKCAVHLYCREKTAVLWTATVLSDTSLQFHLLPMPQKFIVFFGVNEMYRSSKGAMYDTIGWKKQLFNFCCTILSVDMQAGKKGCSGRESGQFLRNISLTLVKTLVNLQRIRTRKDAAEVAPRNTASFSYIILCVCIKKISKENYKRKY